MSEHDNESFIIAVASISRTLSDALDQNIQLRQQLAGGQGNVKRRYAIFQYLRPQKWANFHFIVYFESVDSTRMSQLTPQIKVYFGSVN